MITKPLLILLTVSSHIHTLIEKLTTSGDKTEVSTVHVPVTGVITEFLVGTTPTAGN